MLDIGLACERARDFLRGEVAGAVSEPFCLAHQREVQKLVASGPCAAIVETSDLTLCLLGQERTRLQSVLDGRGLPSAGAVQRLASRDNSLVQFDLETMQGMSLDQLVRHLRFFKSAVLADVLDIALGVFPHASPLATLYAALAQLGTDGTTVLRTVLRYGPEPNAMEAAFALLMIDGDREAAQYLTTIAKAPMPPDASGLLYGRGIRAMSYLRRAGTQVDVLRLADIAVNAPLFTSPDSPAPRMEAAKQRLAVAGGMREAPTTYREELFREILLHARGVEALRIVIADRVHAEALLRAELGAGAEDASLAATYGQIEAMARDATGDARARKQARALLQQLPPCP